MAPDSTRSGSPGASRQRATAKDGWWRTWTCTGSSVPESRPVAGFASSGCAPAPPRPGTGWAPRRAVPGPTAAA